MYVWPHKLYVCVCYHSVIYITKICKKEKNKDKNKQKFYFSPTLMVETTGLDLETKLQGVQIYNTLFPKSQKYLKA